MRTTRFFLLLSLVALIASVMMGLTGVEADSQAAVKQAAPTEVWHCEFQSIDEIAESIEHIGAAATYTLIDSDVPANTSIRIFNSSGDSFALLLTTDGSGCWDTLISESGFTACESGSETITVYNDSTLTCDASWITEQQTAPYQWSSTSGIAATETYTVQYTTASAESLVEQAATSDNVLPAYSYQHPCKVVVAARPKLIAVASPTSCPVPVYNGTNGGVGWGSLWLKT